MSITGPLYPTHGYDANATVFNISPTVATKIENFRFDGRKWSERYGQIEKNASALASGAGVLGLFFWQNSNSGAGSLVATAGATIQTAPWSQDNSALTFTDRTGATTVTTNHQRSFDVLNAILIVVGAGGVGDVPLAMTAYDSNAANLGGSPPNGTFVKVVNNFAFIAGAGGANQSRVRWSNVGDPETWGAANFVDFRKNDGDVIVGLGYIGTNLYIFKTQSIGRLSTIPPSTAVSVTLGPLDTVSDRIGAISHYAIDNLPNGNLVFLGSDMNLYEFDGVVLRNLSDQGAGFGNVRGVLQVPDGGYSSSFTTTRPILKVYPPLNEVWIAGNPTGSAPTHNTTTLVYNYLFNAWYKFTDKTFDSMALAGPMRSNPVFNTSHVLFGGTDDGFVVQHEYESLETPTTDSGSRASGTIELAYPLGAESSGDIARSLVLQSKFLNSVGGSSTGWSVTFGFDETFNSSSNYTVTVTNSTLIQKTIIPIPYKSLQSANRFTTLLIRLVSSSSYRAIFLPIWLSTEVEH